LVDSRSRTGIPTPGRSGSGRISLRSELLFQLACLAAAAVLLALWTTFLLRLPFFERASLAWLFFFVAVDLLLFVLLGNYLLNRLVVRPLRQTATAAEIIAGGDYDQRVPPAAAREIDAVARAINRLTDQLLQNQARLAENVRSLDRTNLRLVDAQRDLVQAEKLAAIGRLAAGVAHEIGNPLGSLLGYAAVLQRRGGDAELAAGIEREARRIDRIVRGLLDYARPAAATREPVDVNESIRKVITLLREQGRLARIEVSLDLAPELPPLEAVPHAFEQIWVNLFLNAEAAMRGEGRLRVQSCSRQYRPARPIPKRRADDPPGVDYSHLRRTPSPQGLHSTRIEPGTQVIEVRVSDSGPGVPPEHAEHIFDPFFTTKEPGAGTGLGLAIVASTVADLGGRIELAPPGEGGATFIVSLPIRGGAE
jgi:two-component system NtrC family sensor kinase